MNVPTMTMDRHDADAHLREYQDAIAAGKAQPGDEALLEGFRAMKRGRTVIDLLECFAATGLDFGGRPKLAVCRADARMCHLEIYASQMEFRADARWIPRSWKKSRIILPRDTFSGSPGARLGPGGNMSIRLGDTAMVPLIPPRCRPNAALENYLILWEAEWQTKPPRDPFLLRPLRWPLFWVVAHWDLTPLEMSVLRSLRVS